MKVLYVVITIQIIMSNNSKKNLNVFLFTAFLHRIQCECSLGCFVFCFGLDISVTLSMPIQT